jgi:hypothetical protein
MRRKTGRWKAIALGRVPGRSWNVDIVAEFKMMYVGLLCRESSRVIALNYDGKLCLNKVLCEG